MSFIALGDVTPANPSLFSLPSSMDFNGSGDVDFLLIGGNGIITDGNTSNPVSPRWDRSDSWRAWDSDFDLGVGNTALGRLSLYGGGQYRNRHLRIGKTAGACGYVTISGEGTLFSNTRQNVSFADRLVTRLAQGTYGSDRDAFLATVAAIDYDDIGAYTSGATYTRTRRAKGSWNVWAGMAGWGGLLIESGARMEVEHQLLIGGEFVDDEWVNGEGGYAQLNNVEVMVYGVAYVDDVAEAGDPSRIGANGLLDITGSNLSYAQGVNNEGVIVVRASSYRRPTYLRGDLTNSGTIYVEEGATLIYEGTYTGAGGVIYRAKCGDPAVIIGLPGVEVVDSERVSQVA